MRRNLLVLIAMIACSILLQINQCSFRSPRNQADTNGTLFYKINPKQQRGLLMQLTESREQVMRLLGDPENALDAKIAQTNRDIMRHQQYLDFAFILLYWGFFVFVVSAPLRRSGNNLGKLLGQLLVVCITATAVVDYVEDAAILHVLDGEAGAFWPHPFGLAKWTLFFLALGISAYFLSRYPKFGVFPGTDRRWPRGLYKLTGWFFAAGAVAGVAGVVLICSPLLDGRLLTLGQLLGILLGFVSFLLAFITDAWALQHN